MEKSVVECDSSTHSAAIIMIPGYEIIENTHLAAGVLSNCLLLFAIRRYTKHSLGSYKQLLTIFAAFDVFLTVLHAIVQPRVMVVEITIFGVAADWDDRYITAFYCSCNTVPFILMNIHFLYRYWAIRSPHRLHLFSTKKFIALLFFLLVAEYVVWFFVCTEVLTGQEHEIGKTLLQDESERRLGKTIHEGWLVMNYWENDVLNVRIFVALMIFNTIMLGCFAIATVLGGLTFYHIYVLRADTISVHAHNMQRKLFISVCVQTFIPLVCVYIPYFCVLNLPFAHLPVFSMDDACMLLTSCFPAWDAVIIIILMKDYREGLLSLLSKKKATQHETLSIPTIPTALSH